MRACGEQLRVLEQWVAKVGQGGRIPAGARSGAETAKEEIGGAMQVLLETYETLDELRYSGGISKTVFVAVERSDRIHSTGRGYLGTCYRVDYSTEHKTFGISLWPCEQARSGFKNDRLQMFDEVVLEADERTRDAGSRRGGA